MFLSQKCCFGFCVLGFEVLPHTSCYFPSITDKTHCRSIIAFFVCNFCSLLRYVRGVLVTNHFSLFLTGTYIWAIHQTITHKEHLRCPYWSVAIFSIASEVFESWSSQKKVPKQSQSQFFKVNIFQCFDVCSVQPPQLIQAQAKISTARPVFPDYISISYDYGAIICLTTGPKIEIDSNSTLNIFDIAHSATSSTNVPLLCISLKESSQTVP